MGRAQESERFARELIWILCSSPGKRTNRPNTYQYFRELQANCLSPKNKCKDVDQINDVESG